MTYTDLVQYLESKGYQVLGEELGMVFYKKDGKVEGAGLDAVYEHVKVWMENKNV